MIATHDTYTYSNPTNIIYRLFKSVWRTQDYTIYEQYISGVRYFDIRVYYNKSWIMCHGLVDFPIKYDSLNSLCSFITTEFPEAHFRILLEKGNDVDRFITEINEIKDLYDQLDWAVIKNGWKTILSRMPYEVIDINCHLNTLSQIIEFVKCGCSIKNWAKKHNPQVTEEMIKDKTKVYFMDFPQIEYKTKSFD